MKTTPQIAHTPGPWKFNQLASARGLLAITTADETQNVANVFGLPLGEVGQANACLIAAAPDLLTTCKLLVAGFDKLIASDIPPVIKAVVANLLRAEGQARVIINRAEAKHHDNSIP